MPAVTLPILLPRYLTEFVCIAERCEDSCCTGHRWIYVDEDTAQRYRECDDAELRPLFAAGIGEHDVDKKPVLKTNPSCECVFLHEGRCRIQARLGEDFLSHTCSLYPRIPNRVNGVIERSATLACPEAARLALLNPQAMELVVQESELSRWSTAHYKAVRSEADFSFEKARGLSIALLQYREVSLERRLAAIGILAERLIGSAQEEESSLTVVAQFPVALQDESFWNGARVGGPRERLLLKEFLEYPLTAGVSGTRYRECLLLAKTLWGTVDEATLLRKACEEYYAPFFAQHPHALENHLLNELFKEVFPDPRDCFRQYVSLAIRFALLKLLLVSVSGANRGLTPETLVLVVQAFTKSFEHLPGCYERMEATILDRYPHSGRGIAALFCWPE